MHVTAIVTQQLSTKAAATILARFLALFPNSAIPDAAAIDALSDAAIRAVGFSTQKVSYLRDLCAKIKEGTLVLPELDSMPDGEVVARLTAVKGFGRWTTEMSPRFRPHSPHLVQV